MRKMIFPPTRSLAVAGWLPAVATRQRVGRTGSDGIPARRLAHRRRAFSLLELFLVVTVLGIIAALIISRVGTQTDSARQKLNAHHKAAINTTVERYYLDTGMWPTTDLHELAQGGYFPDGVPVSPYDGVTPYTIDNTTHRVNNVPDP